MSQYYRYSVELTDGGRRIRVSARDPGGETINEPGGECGLSEVPPRISQLAHKVRHGSPRPAEMDELGEALFEALFPREVMSHFRDLLSQVGREDAILRLELDLDEAQMPQVAALPWEFLRAPQTTRRAADNLGTHPKVVLSRRRALWDVAQPITLTEPLRIQLVVSAPEDLGPVLYEDVEAALQKLAREHPDQVAPPLETLHKPNITSLEQALETRHPHVLHFIGHGRLRKVRSIEFGELALVGLTGGTAWRTDEELGEVFQVYSPPVVVLHACESGAAGTAGAFVGVASQVVQRNVPVVVAVQYPISNAVAIAFAEEFYCRLGKFEAVDVAVQRARRCLSQKFRDARDFAAPVLFMRVKDGRLFVPKEPAEPLQPEKDAPTGPETPVSPIQPFPAEFCTDLPHPIAVACAGFNAAQSDKERFEALDRLLVNLVKYLTSIALSQYWQDNPDKEQLRAWLGELSESQLVTSLNILNQVSDHYLAAEPKPTIYPALFRSYQEPADDETPITTAHRMLRRQMGRRARAEDITPRSFLSRLLDFRDTKWESDPGEIDAATRESLLPVLYLAVRQLLDVFQILFDYPLYYVERIDRTEKEWVYTLVAFPGAAGEPTVIEPFHEPGTEKPACSAKYLYLCSPEGRPLLNLHPILYAHRPSYKLYFLERVAESGEILYRHCASADRYYPPDYYRILSGSWAKWAEEIAEGDDPVAQLEQARTELREAENQAQVNETPLLILLTHLSTEGRRALEIGLGESLRIGRFWLGVEFLLMGLSKQDGCPLSDLFHEWRMSRGEFRGALRGMVGVATEGDWRNVDVAKLGAQAFDQLRPANPATLAADFTDIAADEEISPVITPRMMRILRDAVKMAGEGQVNHAHLLLAALKHPHSLPVNLLLGLAVQAGWEPRDVPAWVAQQANLKPPELAPREAAPSPDALPAPLVRPDGIRPPSLKVRGVLAKYGRDLTDLAQRGELRQAVGENAHKAMVQMGLILQQTQANNPILLGDPGVGKTAIVEGFAYRLATDPKVVSQLAGKRIVDLPPAALLAGTKYRGDLEERLQKLVDEVGKARRQTIVFIDEIHTILGGKAEGGLGAIADALKPALARGEFPCIGATTVGEYRRYIEADPALARRFTAVWIEEPKIAEAIEIVGLVAQKHLGPDHGVTYPPSVIEEAVRLSVRYLHDEFLPGKAIKLLDQAGPRVIMGGSLSGRDDVDQDQPVGGVVTVEIIREIVSERTGVPLTRLSQDDKKRMLNLEDELKERVKGQDEAVREVARVVKRARAGLADPRRPPGVFLFAGPTGVGKTELALALAEALFDEEEAILRLDMSEYLEKHQVSRLIGSPPGYVGYHEEGQLTGRLRRRPYSVVLLDEIEKAHEDVQHLFLQLFDAGRLTDARGNLADGRNAIFVMTTNLGAKEALGFLSEPLTYREKLQTAIEKHFTPEFLNRIDRIIYFEPLTEELLLEIFDKLFKPVAERFQAQGIEVKVTEPFKRKLCEHYASEKRGARPLARGIEDEIVAPLTDKLLAGEIGPGMKVVVGEGAEWEVSVTPLPSGFEEPVEGPAAPPSLDPQNPDARDELKAQNEAVFDHEFDALAARLRVRGIEIEIDEPAQEFLCDPFWTQTTLDQALVKMVEQPLLEQLEAGDFEPGDHVRIEKYADHLEFKTVGGDEQ